jgi:hypothetical protein
MPVIPVLGKLRQKDQEFEVSLAYIVSKKKKKKRNLFLFHIIYKIIFILLVILGFEFRALHLLGKCPPI